VIEHRILLSGTTANNVRPPIVWRAAAGAHAILAWISTARQKNCCDRARDLAGGQHCEQCSPGIIGLTCEEALRRGAELSAAAFGRWAHEAPRRAQMVRVGLELRERSCDGAEIVSGGQHGVQARAREPFRAPSQVPEPQAKISTVRQKL